jgi:hypothetical protein
MCALLAPYLYDKLKPYYLLEGFNNNDLENLSNNNYPLTENNVLIQDSYKISGKNGVTKDQGSKIWWHYPIFKVGSFKQLTNNLRYYKNPDTGVCMAADFCGTLYKDNKAKSNIITQLPPVEPSFGARVNYYNTADNMLAYRSDTVNILY